MIATHARNRICCFGCCFFLASGFANHSANLPGTRPIEVIDDQCTRRQFPRFDSTVPLIERADGLPVVVDAALLEGGKRPPG